MGGFGDWSDLCRQSLLWLGCDDAAASVSEAMSTDPDRATLGRLIEAWFVVFGKTPAMVRDAIERSEFPEGSAELSEVLRDIAEERGVINRKRLGRWIKRHSGRVVSGRRFVQASVVRSAEAWQIDIVE
jgi:hypothetical protein